MQTIYIIHAEFGFETHVQRMDVAKYKNNNGYFKEVAMDAAKAASFFFSKCVRPQSPRRVALEIKADMKSRSASKQSDN